LGGLAPSSECLAISVFKLDPGFPNVPDSPAADLRVILGPVRHDRLSEYKNYFSHGSSYAVPKPKLQGPIRGFRRLGHIEGTLRATAQPPCTRT
jgi:hypothetical protein